MIRSSEVEVKVGIFVAIGLLLAMITIMTLGGGKEIFRRSVKFHTKFASIEGLIEGANVKMSGIRVGQVSEIRLLKDTGEVDVYFTVGGKYREAVRTDSTVSIATQGVLGDRYLVVNVGPPTTPMADNGAELRNEVPRDFKDYLNTADDVLERLNSSLANMENILASFNKEKRAETFFKNLTGMSSNMNEGTKGMQESMKHFNSILMKIDNGDGTLGALVNDPTLYEDMRALLGGANRNRVLKYFIKKSVEESREAAAAKQVEKK